MTGAVVLSAVALVPGVAAAAPASVSPVQADLSVTLDGSQMIPANGLGEVDVTVTNHGRRSAVQVRTLVALPAGIVAVDGMGPVVVQNASGTTYRFDEPVALGSGESRTYSLLVATTRSRPTTGNVTATSRSQTLDPALRNNTARRSLSAAGGPPGI